MSRIVFNRRWATLLLETLTRHGVGHVCIAPGSRSTPLTLAAAAHPRLTLHTHFDERGLGHLALGLAKAGGQPVAVIVTSGTAAANLYPALIEASLTGERLVLLTADRPAELIDCGANQAIRQPGMFAGFAATDASYSGALVGQRRGCAARRGRPRRRAYQLSVRGAAVRRGRGTRGRLVASARRCALPYRPAVAPCRSLA